MTRGNLSYIGPTTREIELLLARLTKEGYEVERYRVSAFVYGHAFKAKPLAVLVSDSVRKSVIDGLGRIALRANSGLRRLPLIVVGHDEIDPKITALSGVSEVWRLHQIHLAEAVKRLRFAIKMCQISM